MTRRTVGIVGGMGPAATVDFFDRIVRVTAARRDQDHLHVIVDNDPSIPDRTLALLRRGTDPTPSLIRSARLLERAGAELIVIACNTAAAFEDAVAEAIGVPVIRWISEVVQAIAGASSYRRVALLATDGTVETSLYQRALAEEGLKVSLPDPADQAAIMQVIYGPDGVKAGGGDPAALDDVVEHLADTDADAALVACTDLSALYRTPPAWPIPLLDAAQIVAERTVSLAGGSLRPPTRGVSRKEEAR